MEDVNGELAGANAGSDMAQALHHCLMRLPEDQRTVLLLVGLEDMSHEDVAAITGVSLSTVVSRLWRARNRLRELMEGRAGKTVTS